MSVCWGRGASWAWGRQGGGEEQVQGWAPRSRALGREELWGSLGAWEPDSLGRTEGYGAECGLSKSRVGVCRGRDGRAGVRTSGKVETRLPGTRL